MSEITVAIRYAKALIDLAQEQNSLEAVKNDMELFLRTVKASSELGAVLANPIISHSKKVHILADVFGASVSKVTLAFLNIMVNKGRGEVLFTTAQEFIGLYDIKNHITNARVVTASPLSAENKKKMLDNVQKAIGGTVKLKDKVDPSLIGGFVLTVGDRQVDTSIASSLKRMKKEFAQVAIK
ncbi:F0F1 ATP synthase subunit delta [Mucilaginibacter sp. 14171R-50]|uniref:ATP synthase F1 subunit delta n=1 Tax=Mucilaginibacter sp. 14171R-50 TaxID=2703789 RepID=UPI00138B7406|nr:ATP synthase F1 subunit delta [Mucilaginibacter sp. 14171R-50]QHS55760.1 F0F1 ATP synthase subunit delta [Mucilaginibacter sp. 14171R-50]